MADQLAGLLDRLAAPVDGTEDAHLIAVDAVSGQLLWQTQVADLGMRAGRPGKQERGVAGGLILVVNAGSSSIKFAVFTPDLQERLSGIAAEIGADGNAPGASVSSLS